MSIIVAGRLAIWKLTKRQTKKPEAGLNPFSLANKTLKISVKHTLMVTMMISKAMVGISSAMLSDAPFDHTQAFDLETQVDGGWKKIAKGTTLGDELRLTFSPVKARLFRLNIQQASDTPMLAEFQLFGK